MARTATMNVRAELFDYEAFERADLKDALLMAKKLARLAAAVHCGLGPLNEGSCGYADGDDELLFEIILATERATAYAVEKAGAA